MLPTIAFYRNKVHLRFFNSFVCVCVCVCEETTQNLNNINISKFYKTQDDASEYKETQIVNGFNNLIYLSVNGVRHIIERCLCYGMFAAQSVLYLQQVGIQIEAFVFYRQRKVKIYTMTYKILMSHTIMKIYYFPSAIFINQKYFDCVFIE